MVKKRIITILLIVLLMMVAGSALIVVKETSESWYKNVEIAEYGLQISYPRAYKDIEKEESNVEKIGTNIETTIIEEDKENSISVDLIKELIHAKSQKSKLTILIEGIKKEKTKKTIEQICKDYMTMFKVYNEDVYVLTDEYYETTLDGVPVGVVEMVVEGKTELVYPKLVAYLIPLEDREITITFTGTLDLFEENQKEVNKIINSVKLYKAVASGDNIE